MSLFSIAVFAEVLRIQLHFCEKKDWRPNGDIMHKGRIEAFSDGVIAILITIMVLELKVPHGPSFYDLLALGPVFFSYVLSFIYLAVYWNNHHHTFQTVKQVNGTVLWANTHLLFWLSLLPFVTAWAGETQFAPFPTFLYGLDLFMCAIAYFFLVRAIISHHGKDHVLAVAVGKDIKGKASVVVYGFGTVIAFYHPLVAFALYSAIAALWLVPDSRIERLMAGR
jgi:uncharacterized membrane protein